MITRKEYMSRGGLEAHQEYYAQFVNEQIKSLVLKTFGLDTLKEAFSKDVHLNSIPIAKWDRLSGMGSGLCYRNNIDEWNRSNPLSHSVGRLIDRKLLKEAGEGYSLSTSTCILKEAARQLVEEAQSVSKAV